MAQIYGTVPTFIGGVSQQNAALRLNNQCTLQENFHCTAADGLIKRPNTELIKTLGPINTPTGMYTHSVDRDVNEKYFIIFTTDANNPVKVYDLSGNPQTVRYGTLDANFVFTDNPSVKTYLTAGGITNAKSQIKAVSVADHTFVLNTQKVCQKDAAIDGAMPQDDIYVYVKSRHNGTLRVTLSWTQGGGAPMTASVSVSSGDNASDTAEIASKFAGEANNAIYSSGQFDISTHNSVVWFRPKAGSTVDPGSVRCVTSDGWGGQDLVPIVNSEIDDIDKLPPSMPTAVVIKIGGDRDLNQDDYWLKYDPDRKRWYEWRMPGLQYRLDPSTMPHRLVRTAAGQFTFATCNWTERTVGDDDTNWFPSFTGERISNLSFYKNRLVFYSKDNSICSKAGEYYDFFKSTVLEVLDGDPVDESAASEQVNMIVAGKAFEKGLVLFSDAAQFVLTSGDQLFGPKTVAADQTTKFTTDRNSDPVKLGADIYFVSPRSRWLSVRQYTVLPSTSTQDAINITAHVPSYIPKGDVSLTGSNLLDVAFLHTSADPKALFVHQFLWEGESKVQQAWYRWTYESDIVGVEVFGTELWLLFYDAANGYRLEKSELESIPFKNEPFRYHLDSLMELTTGTFDGTNTVYTLPRNIGTGGGWVVLDALTSAPLTQGCTLAPTTMTLAGNTAGRRFLMGVNYTARYRFSEFYRHDSDSRSMIAGKLQIHSVTLSFQDTGYFRVEVTPFRRDTMVETLSNTMSGIRVGETVIGEVSLLTGEKTFMVAADSKMTNIDIVTDSYLPVRIQTAVWEGTFTQHSKGR